MRKGSIELTLDSYLWELNTFIDILNKVIDSNSVFSKDEKSELFEAFVLKACAAWEEMVENLFVDCLNRDSKQYSDYMELSLPKHMSHNQSRAMIVGIGYFDFKGVNDIKSKAKHILVDEFNPFKNIPTGVGKKIDEFYKFRNFIAHRSIRSELSLKKVFTATYKLKKIPKPGHFLLAHDNKIQGPRLGTYMKAFIDAVIVLGDFFGFRYGHIP
jgi:hypothetical protein